MNYGCGLIDQLIRLELDSPLFCPFTLSMLHFHRCRGQWHIQIQREFCDAHPSLLLSVSTCEGVYIHIPTIRLAYHHPHHESRRHVWACDGSYRGLGAAGVGILSKCYQVLWSKKPKSKGFAAASEQQIARWVKYHSL